MTDRLHFRECPACGTPAQSARTLFESMQFGEPCQVFRCAGCGLVFKAWFPAPNAIGDLYPSDYVHFAPSAPGPAELNSAKQKLRRCQRLLGEAAPVKPRLLDVGCGSGQFVNIARSLGYEAQGIDAHLPPSLEGPLLRRALPGDLPEGAFDIVVLLNVAEHVPEPRPFFASIRRLLQPHGVMLLTCPYGDSLARRFHRERWVHLALDEHVLFWTPRALSTMLRTMEFKGPTSWRIADSPFPYGRTGRTAANADDGAYVAPAATKKLSLQSAAWRVARRVQASARVADLVRGAVHATRTGDYLEFAISTR